MNRPVDNVQMMRAEIRDLPAGIIQKEAELVVAALYMIWRGGCGPQPEVVVEFRRHGHRLPRRLAELVVLRNLDFNPLHVAQKTVSHEFASLAELRGGTLLAASLQDAARLFDDLADLPPFGHKQRKRLLQIDVLPVARRVDGDQRMPMVRNSDDDGVDVARAVQVAEIMVRLAIVVLVLLVDQRLRRRQMAVVNVAHGFHDAIVMLEKRLQIVRALIRNSDEA